jgi:hypothetical protein
VAFPLALRRGEVFEDSRVVEDVTFRVVGQQSFPMGINRS